MKIVAISDTHGRHHQLQLPDGDLIIHAGDISMKGMKVEIEDFLNWYSGLDYKHKIFIAGNHDFYFEDRPAPEIEAMIPDNVIYLQDNAIEIEGLTIWGSPITPWFYDWAFNRQRGEEIKKYWDAIPDNADIVITHGPMFGALDRTRTGYLVGCEDLYNRLMEVKPKYHICGHIHEAYGMRIKDGIECINASVLDLNYNLVNDPILFKY